MEIIEKNRKTGTLRFRVSKEEVSTRKAIYDTLYPQCSEDIVITLPSGFNLIWYPEWYDKDPWYGILESDPEFDVYGAFRVIEETLKTTFPNLEVNIDHCSITWVPNQKDLRYAKAKLRDICKQQKEAWKSIIALASEIAPMKEIKSMSECGNPRAAIYHIFNHRNHIADGNDLIITINF